MFDFDHGSFSLANDFSEIKNRGRKTRCLPASADTAWNLDQPLLEANTRRVVFSSTTKHAHAAGHVHHHSHHHVVRLSKLHNTTRLLSFKITVSCGNERSITQFSALVNPNSAKKCAGSKFDRLRRDIRIVAAQRRHARGIAAHAADIAKGLPQAIAWDREMAVARKNLDWPEQIRLALDPVKAQAYRDKKNKAEDEACSMCGDYCAVKIVGQYLEAHRKKQ